MQDGPEGGFLSRRPAQQINEGVLKARRGHFNLNVRELLLAQGLRAGLLFQDQAYRAALNHAVADGVRLQRFLQKLAVIQRRAGGQDAAPGHLLG